MRIGIDIDGVLQNMQEFIFDYGAKFCYENNIKFEIHDDEYDETKMLRYIRRRSREILE